MLPGLPTFQAIPSVAVPSPRMIVSSVVANPGNGFEPPNPDVPELDVDRGIDWAMRERFSRPQIQNFTEMLNLIKPIHINPKDIRSPQFVAQGSFGTIYRATCKGNPVAVKKILKEQNSGKSVPQRMREVFLELHVMHRLNHPYVLKLLGVSAFFPAANQMQEMYLGIVLEMCDGTLQKLIQDRGRQLSFDEKTRLAQQVLMAGAYLHSQNIIHRDFTTENILLLNGNVRVADFGCARKISEGKYDSSTISGSPAYMPPEQMSGGRLSLKVDVWAMGVILWEIATRKAPWAELGNVGGMEGFHLIREALMDRKQQLAMMEQGCVPPNKYDAYNQLIGMAMQWNAEARPSSEQLLHDFQAVVCDPNQVLQIVDTTESVPQDPPPVPPRMNPNGNFEQRVTRFYQKYNPTKLAEVGSLVSHFGDKEDQLNEMLRQRYQADLSDTDVVRAEGRGESPPRGAEKSAAALRERSAKETQELLEEKDAILQHQETKIEMQGKRIAQYEQEVESLRLDLRGTQQKLQLQASSVGDDSRVTRLNTQLTEIKAALALREEQLEDERRRVSTLETHIATLKREKSQNMNSNIVSSETKDGASADELRRKDAEIAGLRKQLAFQQRKIQQLEIQVEEQASGGPQAAARPAGQVFM